MQRTVVHATLIFVVFVIGVLAILLTSAVVDGLASNPSVTFSVVSPTQPARSTP